MNDRYLNSRKFTNGFEEMQLLSRNIQRIRFTTRGDPPNFYFVDMDICSLIIDNSNKLKKANNFKFSINLSNNYPIIPPSFEVEKGSNVPFHPHFYDPSSVGILGQFILLFKKANWVDYLIHDPKEGLGSYVLRIAHSLQFDPQYIFKNPPSGKIGNSIALNWYLLQMVENPGLFPIDKIPLPKSLMNLENPEQIEYPSICKKLYTSKENLLISKNFQTTTKKFEVTGTSQPYQPENKSESELEFSIIGRSSVKLDFDYDITHKLYIDRYAAEEIMSHIDWGKDTVNNRVEQGGLLLGNVYVEPKKEILYGIVEEVIFANLARTSCIDLEMNFDTWKEMIDKIDSLFEHSNERKLQVIGWFHTHPGNLDVFMSDTDKRTQKRFFNKDWQFTIVLNPHKEIWKVYFGKNSMECKGYVTLNKQLRFQ